MNDRILYIKWDSGEMEIVLAEFFPTTIERFKKLLRIIRLDWQNQDEIIESIQAFLEQAIDDRHNSNAEIRRHQKNLTWVRKEHEKRSGRKII